MAITIRLGSDLYKHYVHAMNKAKMEISETPSIAELTRDNFEDTIKALEDMHNRSFRLKTKTVEHMERMYAIEQILNKIRPQSIYFQNQMTSSEVEEVAEEEPANSDTIDETAGKDIA